MGKGAGVGDVVGGGVEDVAVLTREQDCVADMLKKFGMIGGDSSQGGGEVAEGDFAAMQDTAWDTTTTCLVLGERAISNKGRL
jgi:hypothetical protein